MFMAAVSMLTPLSAGSLTFRQWRRHIQAWSDVLQVDVPVEDVSCGAQMISRVETVAWPRGVRSGTMRWGIQCWLTWGWRDHLSSFSLRNILRKGLNCQPWGDTICRHHLSKISPLIFCQRLSALPSSFLTIKKCSQQWLNLELEPLSPGARNYWGSCTLPKHWEGVWFRYFFTR